MKRTIVIISSDILFPQLFETLLFRKIKDLEIISCKSMHEIDQKLAPSVVDLILLDSILNNTPSFEVMRYIRMEKFITSPIYFFPEIHTENYTYKSYVMGTNLIINKPFDPYKITDMIISFLNCNNV
jgi:DNA-binding response OmpR family regulator